MVKCAPRCAPVTLGLLTVSANTVCKRAAAAVVVPVLLRGSEVCEKDPCEETVNSIQTAFSVRFGFLNAYSKSVIVNSECRHIWKSLLFTHKNIKY